MRNTLRQRKKILVLLVLAATVGYAGYESSVTVPASRLPEQGLLIANTHPAAQDLNDISFELGPGESCVVASLPSGSQRFFPTSWDGKSLLKVRIPLSGPSSEETVAHVQSVFPIPNLGYPILVKVVPRAFIPELTAFGPIQRRLLGRRRGRYSVDPDGILIENRGSAELSRVVVEYNDQKYVFDKIAPGSFGYIALHMPWHNVRIKVEVHRDMDSTHFTQEFIEDRYWWVPPPRPRWVKINEERLER